MSSTFISTPVGLCVVQLFLKSLSSLCKLEGYWFLQCLPQNRQTVPPPVVKSRSSVSWHVLEESARPVSQVKVKELTPLNNAFVAPGWSPLSVSPCGRLLLEIHSFRPLVSCVNSFSFGVSPVNSLSSVTSPLVSSLDLALGSTLFIPLYRQLCTMTQFCKCIRLCFQHCKIFRSVNLILTLALQIHSALCIHSSHSRVSFLNTGIKYDPLTLQPIKSPLLLHLYVTPELYCLFNPESSVYTYMNR